MARRRITRRELQRRIVDFAKRHKKKLITGGAAAGLGTYAGLRLHALNEDIKMVTGKSLPKTVLDMLDKDAFQKLSRAAGRRKVTGRGVDMGKFKEEVVKLFKVTPRGKSMTKEEILESIKTKSPFLHRITGTRRRLMKEISQLSPRFIKEADIRGIDFSINPYRLQHRKALAAFSPTTRRVLFKRRSTPGAAAHELYHGFASRKYPSMNVGYKITGALGKRDMPEEARAYLLTNFMKKRMGKGLEKSFAHIYKDLPLRERKKVWKDVFGK